MVAPSISSKGETMSNAIQGVGEVHSTNDMEDSRTFKEGRDLTALKPVSGRGGLHSSLETERGTRI